MDIKIYPIEHVCPEGTEVAVLSASDKTERHLLIIRLEEITTKLSKNIKMKRPLIILP
jgi:hypothetical protein